MTYADMKLVETLETGLSVRKFQGRVYLVDDEKDVCIAEAISERSAAAALRDPRTWAKGRLARRLDAIRNEIYKYDARIQELNAEGERLWGFLTNRRP